MNRWTWPTANWRRPWWPGIVVVAVLSVGSGNPRRAKVAIRDAVSSVQRGPRERRAVPCPDGMLIDDGVCVSWPDTDPGSPLAEPEANGHVDRQGHWVTYDQISRRPDLPIDYDAYLYPVPCVRDCVVSGYDLDRRDDLQRRGRRLHEVGHGAVDLVQPKGTPVTMLMLSHQFGDAEVVYAGPLFGTTVITRHVLREGGELRPYLALFGHLDGAAPGIHPGATVKEGDLIGWVGDSGSPELVHLHFEVRRLREGIDPQRVAPRALISNDISVVCDPRNVLPLRESSGDLHENNPPGLHKSP